MCLVSSALQGLAARQDLVIRTLQLERDPPAGNGRIFQPRRDLQAEHLELSLEIGKCAKISMKGGFAGNALGNPFQLLPDGCLSGGEILNLLCLLAKNGGELSDVGLN